MILPNPVGYPESVDAFGCSFANNSCCFLAALIMCNAFPEAPTKSQETICFPVEYQKMNKIGSTKSIFSVKLG